MDRSLENIVPPPDRGLDGYQAQAFLGAVTDGLWSQPADVLECHIVISYRVWQDQSPITESLLQSLLTKHPTIADLRSPGGVVSSSGWFHAGQGDVHAGTGGGSRVCTDTFAAGEGNGGKYESRIADCEGLEKAAGWYKQYHELAPAKLLELKRLVGVCTTLEEMEEEGENCITAAERIFDFTSQVEGIPTLSVKDFWAEFDNTQVAVHLLGVPKHTIRLSDNPLPSGDFETWRAKGPESWNWGQKPGSRRWEEGTYGMGSDRLGAFEGE